MMSSLRFIPNRPASTAGSALERLLRGGVHGPADQSKSIKLRRRELTYLLRNLSALLENGLPLTKALMVLAKERCVAALRPAGR
jgi:type II secretory pathway component PulF